jgi:hypothetical protein
MNLTIEQVTALAPDASSAAAAKKLATPAAWRGLGQSAAALWGECQGTALYQVRVALADLTAKCSCPSRKLPCKHSLGLLLLAAGHQAAVPQRDTPDWVLEWLTKRTERAEKKGKRKAAPEAPPDAAAQARRAGRRLERVAEGLDALDRWMSDLVRNGLAGVETQGQELWETQAARLVDAQAPAVATRVRRLAELPRATPDWPQRLLLELGRLALLTHAFRRLAALERRLQADVRQLLGWTVAQEEVIAAGDVVADDWIVLGQWTDEDVRLRVQRNWLRGAATGRDALVVQFSAGGAPFPETLVPGTTFAADLAFWPSACPQRALVTARRGTAAPWTRPLPGHETVAAFLTAVADAVARQPWLERFACSLRAVTPAPHDAAWYLVDAAGEALRLQGTDHWRLLALSGGAPVDLAGEWDGERLLPLGAVVDGRYEVLWGVRS